MYYTGTNPFTKKEVFIARHLRDRKLQQALLRFFKLENHCEVRKALEQADRMDLIGSGSDALIPAPPQEEALRASRDQANHTARSDYVDTIPNSTDTSLIAQRTGYRPGCKSARRRQRSGQQRA
jgi:hypothetical protein